MKKLTTKMISFILTLSMVLSLSVPAFATENYNIANTSDAIGSQEEIEAAREAYSSLTPEAKAIFDASLANDPDMLKFHTTYVDENFTPPVPKIQTRSAMAAADPMSVLMTQLGGLGLPSAVLYSLKAMGAGMVASIADGPLPVGDILLAAATVSAAVVIVANWDTVAPKWDKIVNAFKKAFSDSATNVTKAFQSIFRDVQTKLETSPSITVSGRTVTINGVKYNCTTRADQLTQSQKKNKKYMPAVLYNDNVWVAASVSLTNSQALLIAKCNNSRAGVWATTSSYARGLCNGGRYDGGNTSEGYYPHYHHITYTKFHCWFL